MNGVTERYVHDGDQVVQDGDAATHNLNVEYGWSGADNLMYVRTPSWTAAALLDPINGTVRGMATAEYGTTLKQYPASYWGEVAADTGFVVRFRHAGREYDAEAGIYYNRARYYDPQLARFLSEDPAGIAGGLNLYTYVGDDPINVGDAGGLNPEDKECHYEGLWDDERTWVWVCPEVSVEGDAPDPFKADGSMPTDFCTPPGSGAPGGRQNPPPLNLGKQGPSCGGAIINAFVTVPTDIAFFTGVGAGIRAARAASFAGRWVQSFGRAQKLRAMYAALRDAIAARSARDFAYRGAEAAYFTGRFSTLGTALAGEDLGTADFSILDLIPVIASIRAIGRLVDACF